MKHKKIPIGELEFEKTPQRHFFYMTEQGSNDPGMGYN